MPRIGLNNLSGLTATIHEGGMAKAILPSGYIGNLNLDGTYHVSLGGSANVNTITNGALVPSTNGFSAVSFIDATIQSTDPCIFFLDGQQFATGWTWTFPVGTDLYRFVPGSGFVFLTTVSNSQSQRITIHDNGFHWFDTNSFQVLSTTNIIGGVDLGMFSTSPMLKDVALHPSSLSLSTYEMESTAFSIGFGLAFTVLVFAFIQRLLRAIPSQGGDF